MEGGIAPLAELGATIGVVKIDDNVGGIEQHDQMLREIGRCVDPQVRVAQQDGSCLGHAGTTTNTPDIEV
jgi:hypothetical protein